MKPLQFIGWALVAAFAVGLTAVSFMRYKLRLQEAVHQGVAEAFSDAQWSMVYSNGVDCPVAIARVVSNRLEELAVDWQSFQRAHTTSFELPQTNRSAFPLNVPPPAWPGGAPQ